jgi:hypothetical protein
MKTRRLPHKILVPLLLSAAASLLLAHLIDLGLQLFGSAPVSTLAVIGNLAGLATCALAVAVGWTRGPRSPACQ